MKNTNLARREEIIEAEVLDENGRPVTAEPQPPKRDRAHTYEGAGFFAGFVALAFSFVMILAMAALTVFVIFPLMLLSRILGMQIKTLRR